MRTPDMNEKTRWLRSARRSRIAAGVLMLAGAIGLALWVGLTFHLPANAAGRADTGMLFPAANLVLFGTFYLVWGLRTGISETGIDDPSRPWMRRRNWASPEQTDVAWHRLAGSGFAMLVGLFVTGGALALLARAWRAGEPVGYFSLLFLAFAAVGVAIFVFALSTARTVLRHGNVRLVLDPHPGSIGGDVGGRFFLKFPAGDLPPFEIRLSGTRTSVGKNKQGGTSLSFWSDVRIFQGTRGVDGLVCVPFRFPVQPGIEPTGEEYRGTRYEWGLSLDARQPGVDLHRFFEIPVFPTAVRSSIVDARESNLEAAQRLSEQLLIERTSGGVHLSRRRGAHRRDGIGGVVMGLVFLVVIVFVAANWATTLADWLPAAVFGGISLLWLGFGLWYCFNELDVLIDKDQVHVRWRWLGRVTSSKAIPRTSVRGFRAEAGQLQVGERLYSLVVLDDEDPDTRGHVVIDEVLRGESQMREVADLLVRWTGMSWLGVRYRDDEDPNPGNP